MYGLLGYNNIWPRYNNEIENLESEGAKKSKYWENCLWSCPNEVISNAFNK